MGKTTLSAGKNCGKVLECCRSVVQKNCLLPLSMTPSNLMISFRSAK